MDNPKLFDWDVEDVAEARRVVYASQITLLDLYAGLAMHAYIGRYSERSNVASYAYDMAEALLKEGEKRRKEREEG